MMEWRGVGKEEEEEEDMEMTSEEGKNAEYKPETSKVIRSSEPRVRITSSTGPQISKVNSLSQGHGSVNQVLVMQA